MPLCGERMMFSANRAGKTGYRHGKRFKLDHIACIKTNSKQINDVSVGAKPVRHLEGNIVQTFMTVLGKEFLYNMEA